MRGEVTSVGEAVEWEKVDFVGLVQVGFRGSWRRGGAEGEEGAHFVLGGSLEKPVELQEVQDLG